MLKMNFQSYKVLILIIYDIYSNKKKTALEDNQLSEEDRKEKLESIVPVKVKSYSHRATTKTQEFDLSQVSPELKYEENMESDLDEELKELEELIKQRKQILKKKMDIEMQSFSAVFSLEKLVDNRNR